MNVQTRAVAPVLNRAGQAHGAVYHYVNGDDRDRVSFYAREIVSRFGALAERSHAGASNEVGLR